MNIIASIQHCGVWFLIDLLKTGHPEPKFEEMHKMLAVKMLDYDLLHTHIGTVSSDEGIHDEDKIKHMLPVYIRAMSDHYNIIIPLRDPVEAIITRQARHPDLSHMHILKAFEYISMIDSVYFFPVDSPRTDKEKYHDTALLFQHAGFKMTGKTEEYIERWEAPEYNKLNCKANLHAHDLKQAYKERDWVYLNKHLKEELAYVRKNKKQLMKFMKSHGYKSLPWYSLRRKKDD